MSFTYTILCNATECSTGLIDCDRLVEVHGAGKSAMTCDLFNVCLFKLVATDHPDWPAAKYQRDPRCLAAETTPSPAERHAAALTARLAADETPCPGCDRLRWIGDESCPACGYD